MGCPRLTYQLKTVYRTGVAGVTREERVSRKNLKTTVDKGLYYYGNRYYNPTISTWLSVDPAASAYPSLSPYAYVANNPLNFIDPTGAYIEPASQKEWDKQTGYVEARRDNLQGRIDKLTAKAEKKGWSSDKLAGKLGNLNERVASLNTTLDMFSTLESSTQGYSLSSGAGEVGSTYYDPSSGNVVINYSSTANFVHESTHAGQFETGDLAFQNSPAQLSYAQDLFDEVSAYKAEFAFSGTSVGGATSSASSFGAITPSFVKGITTSTGVQPYAKHGIIPININSSKADLIKAYPFAAGALKGLPASFTLKSASDIIYKK